MSHELQGNTDISPTRPSHHVDSVRVDGGLACSVITSGVVPAAPETLLVMRATAFQQQFGPAEHARLRAIARVADPVWSQDFASDRVVARLAEVEVLLTSWGCPPLDEGVLQVAPNLRAVIHAAGSVRAHVGPSVFERGILVTTAAAANAEPVSRYTLAAILWSLKKVPFLFGDARLRRADWSHRFHYGSTDGPQRTVVIVGFSRVGSRVAGLLRAVGDMRILVVDPVVAPARIRAAGAEPVGLAEALPQADVLSLHAPLLPETKNMIGAAELAALRTGSTVINTARGVLIDTMALERECATGRLNAVLDVTHPEPLPAASPLYDLPNVVITPHVAGALGAETRMLSRAALTEIERYAAGLPPVDAVTADGLATQA